MNVCLVSGDDSRESTEAVVGAMKTRAREDERVMWTIVGIKHGERVKWSNYGGQVLI